MPLHVMTFTVAFDYRGNGPILLFHLGPGGGGRDSV